MDWSECNQNTQAIAIRNLRENIASDYRPAWSLSALLTKVLPKHLDNFPLAKWYPPFSREIWEMDSESVLNGDVKLYSYSSMWIVDYDYGFLGTLPQSNNPIEAVILAVELLHANGFKLNEIEEK